MPRNPSKTKATESLHPKQYAGAVWRVMKMAFVISPVAIGFKLVSTLFASIIPLATTYFAAQTTTQIAAAFNGTAGARQQAMILVGVTAGLGLLAALQSSITQYVDQLVRFRVESKISDMLFERFIALDFWRYDDKETGDLYEKAKDFSRFFAYVFDRVATVLQYAIGIITALIGLLFVSPWLSLAMLLAIIPNMAIQFRLSRLQIRHWQESVIFRRKRYDIEYNMIDPKQIVELRLYNMARQLLKIRIGLRDNDEGKRMLYEKHFIKWRLAGDAIEAFAELGSLLWIITSISARKYPIGQFVFVQQLVSRSLTASNQLIAAIGTIDEDLAKLKDYDEFMTITAAKKGSRSIAHPVQTIEFRDVSFTYPKASRPVLQHISLQITAGSHIAIVGENGAGKSTFIKLLLGIYRPTEGMILLDGQPLESYDIEDWHKQLGVLMQNFTQYHFATIRDNIVYGNIEAEPTQQRIDKALEAAEAQSIIAKLPNKLDTPASTFYETEEGTQLSGGQWQRIALARNFYRQAPIVILDEPTSAIDALAEARIFDNLFSASNKQTLITISHRLTTIEAADTIYVFENGSVVQQGTHATLAKVAKGAYATLFRRQLKEETKNS